MWVLLAQQNTEKTANRNSKINFYFVTCFYSLYDICIADRKTCLPRQLSLERGVHKLLCVVPFNAVLLEDVGKRTVVRAERLHYLLLLLGIVGHGYAC